MGLLFLEAMVVVGGREETQRFRNPIGAGGELARRRQAPVHP